MSHQDTRSPGILGTKIKEVCICIRSIFLNTQKVDYVIIGLSLRVNWQIDWKIQCSRSKRNNKIQSHSYNFSESIWQRHDNKTVMWAHACARASRPCKNYCTLG